MLPLVSKGTRSRRLHLPSAACAVALIILMAALAIMMACRTGELGRALPGRHGVIARQHQPWRSRALERARAALAQHHADPSRTMIPRITHQVYGLFPGAATALSPHVLQSAESYKRLNPNHTHILWGPRDMHQMVATHWPALLEMWRRLGERPVLQADWARYLLLSTFGGVYADLDTKCLKPVDEWAGGRTGVAAIIGIEADALGIRDWAKWWGRPLQFVQWTLAAAPGHPLLALVLWRSHLLLQAMPTLPQAPPLPHAPHPAAGLPTPVDVHEDQVVHVTGPTVWTEAVGQYLASQGFNASALHGLKHEVQVQDLLVLTITGFSPGVGHMGSEPATSPRAKVQHLFAGAWTSRHSSASRATRPMDLAPLSALPTADQQLQHIRAQIRRTAAVAAGWG